MSCDVCVDAEEFPFAAQLCGGSLCFVILDLSRRSISLRIRLVCPKQHPTWLPVPRPCLGEGCGAAGPESFHAMDDVLVSLVVLFFLLHAKAASTGSSFLRFPASSASFSELYA